ncbi:MAG: hypothetical protein NW206_08065 [Hyphomonadaceae bacterium]|nr:hypothetical protein [Hyphomonadaceae bacterium]
MADGKVPVRESVGAALRFVRENWRPILTISAVSAVVSTVLAVLSNAAGPLSLLITIASTFVVSVTYGAFTSSCLTGFAGVQQRLISDGLRVWGAMAIVGFFLFIVMIVLAIPGVIVFAVMIGPTYGAELQQVSGDEAATTALMGRIVTENPGMILAFLLFYGLLWFALTSRLYLSAPASVEAKRILTFETWSWTRGNMWRIFGARLMLLLPAYVLVTGVSLLLASAIGLNITDPMAAQAFAQANTPLYAIYLLCSGLLQLVLYTALEAGLSTYLYRGLKPATPPPPV